MAAQQNSQLQRMGLASGGPAYGQGHPLLGMQPPQGPGGEHGGRPWGQKISGNDKYNEWKLFVGQVPLEVGLALRLSFSCHVSLWLIGVCSQY